jgi:GxxExxY protein
MLLFAASVSVKFSHFLLCVSAPPRENFLMHENDLRSYCRLRLQDRHNSRPGLLESVYETVLAYELTKRGFDLKIQAPIPVVYDQVKLELGFRADIIVNRKVVIEVKSVDAVAPVHAKQLRTYLRLTDVRLGLLINFNVDLIKNGILRVVNNL